LLDGLSEQPAMISHSVELFCMCMSAVASDVPVWVREG
jgi:hypothetical protein